MKFLFYFILLVLPLNLNAQKPKTIPDTFFTLVDSTDTKENNSPTRFSVDIKKKNWDNTVYNPFKEMVVTFPLKLEFKDSTYHSPIGKDKVITSRFGWRRGRPHKGIDIDLITGDSIYAMFDGIVRMSRYTSGHGRTVVVRHYNGLETVYAHLSKYGVKENDTVFKGSYLGKGGVSGNARGSHLHLVVNYKGIPINPEYLFKFNKDNLIRGDELWVTKKWTRAIAHNSKRQSKITPLFTEGAALASLIKERSIYVVKQGDTLSRISRRNNVSIASICEVNAIRRNAVIRVGQKLLIEK